MPRRARRLQHGDFYHVINRGSVRARLFYTAGDYRAFLALLSSAVERFELPIVSYCLMPNHWHVVTAPDDHTQLSRAFHWLTSTHAMRWTRVHQRRGPGPVYQGRFKSIPVQCGPSLVRVCRYVERNALASGLSHSAQAWPWSSAYQRAHQHDSPRLQALPFLLEPSWMTTLNAPQSDPDVARAIQLTRPFGEGAWLSDHLTAMRLGKTGTRGRPRRKIDPSLL